MNAIGRIREYMASHGGRYTLRRCGQIISERYLGSWDRKREKTEEAELARQRENPPECGLISVVVPIYNTEAGMLREMIQSLQAQTFRRFEVILYDGGSTRRETAEVLAETEAAEPNEGGPMIRVIRGAQNRGISGNTNEAIREARGEYIALCDHDDIVHPEALWHIASAIEQEARETGDGPDVIYTDEDRIMENGLHHMDPHFKPDYSPEYLREDNYICHMAAIRKSLLEEIGGLRSGFDGSQDHDLFLRLSERTDRFRHIPKVLYSWREVRSSRSHTNLQTCLESSCRAVEETERKRGRDATAIPVGKVIRLWYGVNPETSVEVLIHGDSEAACRACMEELDRCTSWRNMRAALIVTDDAARFAAINEAAHGSGAEMLLVIGAGVRGMNRHFIRELMMYAQMDGIAGVTPILTDRKGRIVHGGFAIGVDGICQCINEGLFAAAGGRRDLMNKVHNASAVSAECFMVRKDAWEDIPEDFRSGIGMAGLGLRQKEKGRRYVVTPHATAICEKGPGLLSGTAREEEEIRKFREGWGEEISDPYYSGNYRRDKADYRY